MSTNNNGDSGIFAKIAAFVGLVCVGLGRCGDDVLKLGSHTSTLADDAARFSTYGDDAISLATHSTEIADFALDKYSSESTDGMSSPMERTTKSPEVPYIIDYGNGWESVRVMLMKDGTKYVFNGTETKAQFDSLKAQSREMFFEGRKKLTE